MRSDLEHAQLYCKDSTVRFGIHTQHLCAFAMGLIALSVAGGLTYELFTGTHPWIAFILFPLGMVAFAAAGVFVCYAAIKEFLAYRQLLA